MKWSHYNHLFKSRKYGKVLYNALSNRFVVFSDGTYQKLLRIREDPDEYDFSNDFALFLTLFSVKALIDEREETDQIHMLHMQRVASKHTTQRLQLIIAPTMDCNFRCPYCFFPSHEPVHMNCETEEKLIEFIKNYGHPTAPQCFVVWWRAIVEIRCDRTAQYAV